MGLITVCCPSTRYSFLNPRKRWPRSVLSQLRRTDTVTPETAVVRRAQCFCRCLLHDHSQAPIPQPELQMVNKLGVMKLAMKFASWPNSPISHQLTAASTCPQNFHQFKCFHGQQNVENTFQDFVELWSIQFCYRNKQIYFLLTKKLCWLWFLFDRFETSYSDLKLIWNLSALCLNLIQNAIRSLGKSVTKNTQSSIKWPISICKVTHSQTPISMKD